MQLKESEKFPEQLLPPNANRELTTDALLTIGEVARRLKLKPKSVRNKMSSGIWKLGIHYFRPKGLSTRFSWPAIVRWLRGEDQKETVSNPLEGILMVRSHRKANGLDSRN
jgi:hypothetical protein